MAQGSAVRRCGVPEGGALATTTASAGMTRGKKPQDSAVMRAYLWTMATCLSLVVGWIIHLDWALVSGGLAEILAWSVVAAIADALVVRIVGGLTLSMSLPVTLAAAMIFAPGQAAVVGFLGCLDPMEIRGESNLPRIIFNRAQVALATIAASLTFHASPASLKHWPMVLILSLVALAADFICNALFVIPAVALRYRLKPLNAIVTMFGPVPLKTILLYVSLGAIAPLLVVIYSTVGISGLVVSLIPLALARAMLLQAQHLYRAESRIREKDAALRRSIQQVGAERRDERMALAGELHDEVLPPIFKVHLLGQVLRQDLQSGRLLDLDSDLPELLTATEAAQTAVREVLRDLRRSPIGPGGLIPTLKLLAQQLETSGGPRINLDLQDVRGTELAQLVIYQVAREALTNAAKYSRSNQVELLLQHDEGFLRLVVSDAGVGFDIFAIDATLHFGLQLMRERVDAAGGRLVVDSRLGSGTVIVATVPPDA